MQAHLVNYWLQYGQLALPGLGTLLRSTEGPRYSAADRTFLPPAIAPHWVPAQEQSFPVQHLAAYLSIHTGRSEEESFEDLLHWVRQAAAACASGKGYVLPGLGSFAASEEGTVTFAPDASLAQYYLPIPVAKLIHAGQTHQMTVGDAQTDTATMQQSLEAHTQAAVEASPANRRWWWPALMVGLLASALIALRLAGVW